MIPSTYFPTECVEERKWCPTCDKGWFEPTGKVLLCYPAKYEHKCNNCDQRAKFTAIYPRLVFRGQTYETK